MEVEFDEGGSLPYRMRGDTSPFMVRMIIKLSGGSLSPHAANYVLIGVGVLCITLSILILRATFS